MCTVLLPPGVNPIAVNKYVISYPSYVLRWPDDGYYTAETCRHVVN